MALNKWSGDTESLLTALMDTGWFIRRTDAVEAADNVEFQHVWYGEDGDGELIVCDEHGFTATGAVVEPKGVVTLADVSNWVH